MHETQQGTERSPYLPPRGVKFSPPSHLTPVPRVHFGLGEGDNDMKVAKVTALVTARGGARRWRVKQTDVTAWSPS